MYKAAELRSTLHGRTTPAQWKRPECPSFVYALEEMYKSSKSRCTLPGCSTPAQRKCLECLLSKHWRVQTAGARDTVVSVFVLPLFLALSTRLVIPSSLVDFSMSKHQMTR
mmetsp:Transcript_103182/g.177881  ORF Transcript_103182/g.177881 Transcript_103182/m.177881 type:complete len:111 (-) Transcript_103182:421-753(-)